MDREGVTLESPEEITLDVDYDDAGLDPDDAPSELGRALSALTEEQVEDEEGMFALAVYRGGAPVAALSVSCEDDALNLGGERVRDITDEELAAALVEALRSRRRVGC